MQKKQVDFELAKKVDSLPRGNDWFYELKYDGWRIMAFVNDDVHLITRNQNDATSKFSSIADALVKWQTKKKFTAVLDGELISESFSAIRKSENLTYVVFDLLSLNNVDMRDKPLVERKTALQKLLKTAPAQIQYCEHLETITKGDFEILCLNGHEGIIIKRADSVYTGGRSGNWLKLKNENFSRTKIETPEITSPDKKVFSGVTKADIAEYYKAVFPLIFPHIKGSDNIHANILGGVG